MKQCRIVNKALHKDSGLYQNKNSSTKDWTLETFHFRNFTQKIDHAVEIGAHDDIAFIVSKNI